MKKYTKEELEQEFGICDDEEWMEQIRTQGTERFALVWPSFHSGVGVEFFHSLRQGLRRERRQGNAHQGNKMVFGEMQYGDGCRCGGPQLITESKYHALPHCLEINNAYALAQ